MKLRIINDFDGNDEFIAEGNTLAEALEDALNQLGWTSFYEEEEGEVTCQK